MLHRVLRLVCLLLAALTVQPSIPAVADSGAVAWDPLLPSVISAGAPGDPLAIANASLRASTLAVQTTMDLGRSFLQSLGLAGTDTGVAPAAGRRVSGSQAIEYVIRRAGTQIGVPYSWGGGSLTGPSNGIDSGSGTVGFDCSGLTRYAYAGVGVLLPRWSGDQYNAGRKIPPSQARRGDLLFWGPGGSQHEAIYLGGGQMLEAQQTGVPVKISPVRMAGMTPYVTRIIEG
ncbi:cell wall-associated NlpC family hydrolase [Mycolicibacterium sp. BK556]|uniref:NlpC/P60 family peptidoglycan endopeptidase RipB n=1 Tax=unclassified Mycolicibacterium TaxID=2636767 RepID=UPI001619FE05|nr:MULTISPECIES: NlpC/P60 family peptidoglycan endopeptidase RipB [unclassified Mycolicibacterium]MBB3600874.1 cell wall-associated NlpC family hydrolase [Mycolicibacterium sp. BK556]MBB3630628.1 cell wall-associated NlpC family hydrolase [Mycolicibacterium sp. BK607]MBB3748622.1 cell wall-associated NlpC family hydrolase [Mycolicibacterium sp. BK634]